MLKVIDFDKNKLHDSYVKEFDRVTKTAGAEKVYEKGEYIILKAKKGYIVYNTKKRFKEGHTHIQSFEMSKTIIDNSLRKKRPKTNNEYLIISHIRITKDPKYKKILEELLESKRNKTKDNKYHNRGYCKCC